MIESASQCEVFFYGGLSDRSSIYSRKDSSGVIDL